MTTNLKDTNMMNAKYHRAQTIIEGLWTKKLALNASLFPIWIGCSNCFWYERESKEGRRYRLVNASAATNEMAFDHDVFAAALAEISGQDVNANNLPITQVVMDIDSLASSKKVIKTVHFTAFEQRFIFDSNTRCCTKVDVLPNAWVISPDGKYAVFLKEFNLWVREIDSAEERALTHDGNEDYVYGAAGSGWGYTMEPSAQVRWSADSKRLFTVQRDTREIKDLPVMHHVPSDGRMRPFVVNHKIAYPGDEPIETLRLLSIEVETARQQDANYRQLPITRNSDGFFTANLGWWSTDSRRAYFVDVEQDYKTVRVVEFDTYTGATKVLFEETANTQINLMLNNDELPAFVPLPQSNELLWFSERSGWGHLYLYDLETGKLKQPVTQGDWLVRMVVYIDAERREAFIQTAGRKFSDNSSMTRPDSETTNDDRDPYYRDLCRVHLDTGEITTLASSNHDIIAIARNDMNTMLAQAFGRDVAMSNGVSQTGQFAVVTRSRADEIPVSLLVDREGQTILHLETADVSGLPENWRWPEPVKLLAADGLTDIYGLVFRPSNFSPEQCYPIVSHVFNSPEVPWVAKGSFSNGVFFGQSYPDAAALAELGFIVVQIDARGTPYRHKAFHDESYGWAESASHLDDHVAGIRQLAERYPYMDLTRVGIVSPVGGPGGLQGLLHHPDFYTVGVANALHDSRLMPRVMWSDKYEGQSSTGGEHQYPEAAVEQLQGKLLLIHGMLDTTCPPAGVFRVIEALQKSNKDFDLLLLPNLGHAGSSYVIRRTWDFLVRHLLGKEPPKEYKLTTIFDGMGA